MVNFYARQLLNKAVPAINSARKRQTYGKNETNDNLYEQYEHLYGQKPSYDGPNISPKLPQDQVIK
jgi:hypothetical protein